MPTGNEFASEPSRHEYRLDNGLQVIIKEDHRTPVVISQIWYHVGSADEPEDKGGISHLLEHMMFKGTPTVSGDDFDRLIPKYGGNHNAFTSHDYTGYYEVFPANRLALALELEADRMTNLDFASEAFAEEFKQERQIVMEERRQRTDDSPVARASEKFRLLAMPDSPKGESVIGPMAEIGSITIDELQDWYDTWYAPNNATLVIVGDVDPIDAMQNVVRYFADIPAKTLPKRPSVTQNGMRGYVKKELVETVNVPMLVMAYNVPTVASLAEAGKPTDEAYALLKLQFVLDGGYSARLERRLVREQNLLASIVTYYDLYDRGDGLFLLQTVPRAGVSLDDAQQALQHEIAQMTTDDFDEAVLSRAENNLVKGFVFGQDSVMGQAQMIGSLQTAGLDDRIIEQLPDNVANVTTADIHAVAKKYLTTDNLTVMHVIPYEDEKSDGEMSEDGH